VDIDLDSTIFCPQLLLCEGCQKATDELAVATFDTPVGVYCMTLCPACTEGGRWPVLSWSETALRVGDHCEHLGIDLDQAAEARAQET
jgi:hypothetical protein